jgi:hypothetical protein
LQELSVQFIFKRSVFRRLFHDRSVEISSPDLRYQAILSHDPDYFLVVHLDLSFSLQPHFDCPPAVFRLALVKDFFDQKIITIILVGFIRALQPLIVPAS